jgi:hypothetical protein
MFDLAAAVAEMEQAIDRVARGLEPEIVTASAAMGLLKTVAKSERQLAGVKMRLAGRVAETPVWQHQGHRSPAHWLAGESGTSVAEAVSLLQTAERVRELPATLDAVCDGSLSRSQAAAVADAAAVAPDAEVDLLALAKNESLKGLQEAAARRKVAHVDEQERHARVHASRHVRFGTEPDGAATMSVRATTDVMAEIRAGISHFQDIEFEAARRAGRRDPFEAYAVDGLAAMARAAMTGDQDGPAKRASTKIVIRADLAALERGRVVDGEMCEVAGVGPVPVGQVNDLLATGEAFTAVIGTDRTGRATRVAHIGHKRVVDVQVALDALAREAHDVTGAHTSRKPNVYQRSALDWLSPCCSVEGCDQPRQEIDHRADWADTHLTGLDELDGFCRHHHWLKTHRGYRLEPGTGRRRLVPPPNAHAPP